MRTPPNILRFSQVSDPPPGISAKIAAGAAHYREQLAEIQLIVSML